MLPYTWKTSARQGAGRKELFGRPEEPSVASGLNNIAACEEDQKNQSPTDIVNSAIDTNGSLIVAPDGTQWTRIVFGTNSRGRYSQQNILREGPGATSHARRNVRINSSASAWCLIIDKFILEHIRSCTVTHLQTRCENFTLSVEELQAFTVAFCKQVMSRNRFKVILRFFRFDKKSCRSERLQIDRFALFSMVWNRFVENSIACYKPGAFLTVVEQLFPSEARCSFTQFMASKPDKYGQKHWLALDKDSKYIVNEFPYVGKDELRSKEERVSDHVVIRLAEIYLKKKEET